MMATIWGAEIICPLPIGSGWSRYADSRQLCGTKSSRLTAPIAYTTRLLIPRYLRPFRSDALSCSKGVVLPPLSRLMPSEGKLVPIGTSFGLSLIHIRAHETPEHL